MADSNICNGRDLDFFLVESCMLGGRDSLLGMGMDMYLLFKNDGTVEMLMMSMTMSGTWSDGLMTFTAPDDSGESMEMNYTIEGDLLTVTEEESGETVYRRNDDYESYNKSGPTSIGGGETIDIDVTDGFISGVMSATCPEGWYAYKNPVMDSMFMFTTSSTLFDDGDGKKISVYFDIKECVVAEGEKQPELELGGKVWERARGEEDRTELVTVMGSSAVKVEVSGCSFDDEAVTMALETVLSSVKLVWEREESSLGICEDGETDFFEIRSMSTSLSTGNRKFLQIMGFDWCILFRSDGTVTAKFDGAVNCSWGDGFGWVDVVTGTWNDREMIFTSGGDTGMLPFTLEGDRIYVILGGDPVVFQRSSEAPPNTF